jgi:DNA polymerase-3 subunit beta
MKIKVAKSALLEGLQTVQNVVSTRSTLPILSNVLISADNGKITLTTTDLDVTVSCLIEADVAKAGSSTLPARRLSSIVRELPDGAVDIDIDDKNVASLKSASSQFKIIGLSEDEFPPVPKPDGKYAYHMEQVVLRDMLRKTSYSVSTDETRYVLNGVLVSFKNGKMTMVATDGRRLALVENELEFPKEAERELILPSKAVNELLHTLADSGDIKIHAKDNMVIFQYGEVLLASKLIEGSYPNYKQVIPSQCEERVTVEREAMLSALKRVSLVTTDKSSAAKIVFGKNKITVTTNTPDVGEAKETIPIKYTGKEISVAFNPDYMMDPLRNLTNDEIYVELTDDLSPGVIKCDVPFLYVLMPMRIS